jgi:type II secretory pathway pseudopilin PulG
MFAVCDTEKNRNSCRMPHGITLTEVLVATVIIGVSLIGMVSSWLYMINSAVLTNDRAAGYICARTVIERARANGFQVSLPQTISTPASGVRSTWATPNISTLRYFDEKLDEIPQGNRTQPAWRLASYWVTTEITYSPVGSYPAGREDLRTMTITVIAYNMKTNLELARLQTCLAQGGI